MFLLQANTNALFSVGELQLLAPELILTVCACAVLVMEVVLPYKRSKLTGYFSLIAVALAGAPLLRARRLHQTRAPLKRSGHEVFSARRVLFRHLALRHVAPVWRRRLDQSRRHRA